MIGRKSKTKDNRERTPNKTGVTIREMELDDLAPVFALGENLFTAEKWPTLYRTWDEYELVETYATDGDYCLVAESGDDLIGFALGTIMEKYRSAWRYGWLLWLGVDPEFNGRGIGTRLVNRLTELFIENGARMMLVDTDAENANALNFFRRQGFTNELDHVYLSQNLDTHPKYQQRKAARRQGKTRRRNKPPH